MVDFNMERTEREMEKLVRMTQFWHEMAANHRQITSDVTQFVQGAIDRLTEEEFLYVVSY